MSKKQIDDYYLTVREFANLCGTTRDTLRHYYEIELIVPHVDPVNGYHLYSPYQISSYYYVSTLRELGCSLKEIKALMMSNSHTAYDRILTQKMDELQESLQLINRKIHSIQCDHWLLNKIEAHKTSGPTLETMEDLWVFQTSIRSSTGAKHMGDLPSDISDHLLRCKEIDGICSFPLGTTITMQNLCNQHYVYDSLFSISLRELSNQSMKKLPSRRVITCVNDNTRNDIHLSYEEMIEYSKKQQLNICSDLYILNLVNLYALKDHSYIKYLFLCVE